VQEYPFEINWNATYSDPMQPLVVDIGSGTASLFPSYGFSFFFFGMVPFPWFSFSILVVSDYIELKRKLVMFLLS
jgi:hypothetical protein